MNHIRRDVRGRVCEALPAVGDSTSYANDLYEKLGALVARD